MLRRLIYIVVCLSMSQPLHATDSLLVLSKDEFVSAVRNYHPVVQQAQLQVARAKANVLEARGVFDPVLNTSVDHKSLDGKLYYSYFNPEVSIPTWYGIDIRAGLEEVTGNYVSPEATLGKMSYAGVKMSVADGLLFDKRRAVLRQAQAMRQYSETERRRIVNDLLMDGMDAYWTWVKHYQYYRILTDIVKVNEERLRFVVLEYEQGNRPAIDTTEASAQLQNFRQMLSEAWVDYQNAGLEVATFLWMEDGNALNWNMDIVPDGSFMEYAYTVDNLPALESLLSSTRLYHPKLQGYTYKLNALETERRLKTQSLLPKLDVKANMLSRGYEVPDELSIPFIENNYKLGVDFRLPLFLRQERGALQAAKIKIEETELDYSIAVVETENKVRSYYNELLALSNQVSIYEEAYNNYQQLFRGERIRYKVGESTLFLLNSRENKMLEAYMKLLELKTKWNKSYAALLWSAGALQ